MALGDGRLMSGRSSLDEPTGSKKYSLAAPSSAEKAARRERKSNDLIDRNLQRAMRTGSPQQRIAAGRAYQERSSMPGYQQGGGIQSFEENQQRDRQTGDRFTAEGLRLAGEDPASVIEGQANGGKKSNIGKSTADGGTGSKIGTAPADRSAATTTGALGDGSGSSAANAREALAEGSTGGDWVNVGDGSTKPTETVPAAAPEVGKTDFVADRKLTLNADLARLKTKFEREDAAKKLAEQAESKGVDPKYQATEEQIQEGATLDFGKAYGDYLNGEGRNASSQERAAKYDELKTASNAFNIKETELSKFWKKDASEQRMKPIIDLIPGAKQEVKNIQDLQSDMEKGINNYDARKEIRESGRILSPDQEKEARLALSKLPNFDFQFDKNGPNILTESKSPLVEKNTNPITASTDNLLESKPKNNPVIQDLTDAAKTWDTRWKQGAIQINTQLKKEGEISKVLLKKGVKAIASLIGGRTGEAIENESDAFYETMNNLNVRRKESAELVASNNLPL